MRGDAEEFGFLIVKMVELGIGADQFVQRSLHPGEGLTTAEFEDEAEGEKKERDAEIAGGIDESMPARRVEWLEVQPAGEGHRGDARTGEKADCGPESARPNSQQQQGTERHRGQPGDGLTVDAAFHQREQAKAHRHRSHEQMPRGRERSRAPEKPGHEGEDQAAHHDDQHAPLVIDAVIEHRVDGPEDETLKPEVDDQPCPVGAIRIVLAVAWNEAVNHRLAEEQDQDQARPEPAGEK